MCIDENKNVDRYNYEVQAKNLKSHHESLKNSAILKQHLALKDEPL